MLINVDSANQSVSRKPNIKSINMPAFSGKKYETSPVENGLRMIRKIKYLESRDLKLATKMDLYTSCVYNFN